MTTEPDTELVSALMRVLGDRWVLTLALADASTAAQLASPAPYPTPLFYALAEPRAISSVAAPALIFASDPSSHHGRLLGEGPTPAAAAVYLESETVGVLRGAQLRGLVVREEGLAAEAAALARARYLDRHPPAAPMLAAGRHRIYALFVTWAKLTDNRLGFGVHPVLDFDATGDEVEQSRG